MIRTVQTISEVPATHKTQMRRAGKYYKCPVTGLSRTTIKKVLDLIPGCDGYLLAGEEKSAVRYIPEQIRDNSKTASAAYDRKYNNGRSHKTSTNKVRLVLEQSSEQTAWKNLEAARKLMLEMRDDYIRALQRL